MSTPSMTVPDRRQEILPKIIPATQRRRLIAVTNAGFPYYPDRQAVLAGFPTFVPLEVISRQISIQNNTGAIIYRKYAPNVSTSSFQIAAGQTVIDTVQTEYLWMFSVGATFVNPFQTDGNGIVVEVYP